MPKISFGIIALNALPLLEYNLEALYPFAHEIIVVEGATTAAKSLARPDGHSSDGTLEMLTSFQQHRDPQGKLQIVTAQQAGYSQGFWPEKEEMSRAYAERITGDWLWQVDSDEFYLEEDLHHISKLLDANPSLSGISFPYVEFFGGFGSYITGVWHLYEHPRFNRLFRWGPGYKYAAHRPPTVIDNVGKDLRFQNWLASLHNDGRPIYLYHYSYVFPKQALQKVGYYSHVEWTDAFRHNEIWFRDQYQNLQSPLHLGERPGLQWLERFRGSHPEAIERLRTDIDNGIISEKLRPSHDIDRLLDSPLYMVQKLAARLFLFIFWPLRRMWKRLRGWLVGS